MPPPHPSRALVAVIALVASGCDLGAPGGSAQPRGDVRLFVHPQEASPVLATIAAARESVWMEMYLLTDERAIAALAERAAAGCDVRVVLEPAPYLDERANEGAYARLAAAGARVRWANGRFVYTHAKSFTIDHRRLVVSTANLTRAGLESNREYTVLDDDPADVLAAEAIFAADEVGQAMPPGGRLVASPESSRAALLALLEGASRSISVEVEQLTDGSLAEALGRARLRGVQVAVVLPESHGTNAAVRGLLAAGITVRVLAQPVVHAKAVVIDGARALVGSANLTPTSLDDNRELGLMLDHAEVASELASTITDDAARGQAPSVY